jgi:L-fucose isomerase-like protein
MDALDKAEIDDAIRGIKKDMIFENEISDAVLEKAARLYCVMKGKAESRGLDAISIKCVHGVSAFMGFNPCLAQSLLASKDLSVICECDAYGLITNIILSSLTGQCSAFMENYEVFDDSVLVGVCGFIPRDFIDGSAKIRGTNLGEAIKGISNVSRVKSGTVTYARFFQSGGQYKLFLSKAEAAPSPKWTELGWTEPTPDFPSVLLKLEISVQKYLERVPGQHIIMVYGDWVDQLTDLCALLDIEVVT